MKNLQNRIGIAMFLFGFNILRKSMRWIKSKSGMIIAYDALIKLGELGKDAKEKMR